VSVEHHGARSPVEAPPEVRLAPGAWARAEEPDIDLVPAGVHARIAATPFVRPELVEDARRYLDARPTPSAEVLAGAVVDWRDR
jgi:hypothetical protein